MKKLPLTTILLFFFSQSVFASESVDLGAWLKAGFVNPSLDTITLDVRALPEIPFTHQFSFTAVVIRNSSWSVPEVSSRLKRVSEIYAQCGLKLATAQILEVTPPEGLNLIDDVNADEATELARMIPGETKKPIVFYLKNLNTGPEDQGKPPAVSLGVSEEVRLFLQNTAYISSASKRNVMSGRRGVTVLVWKRTSLGIS